MGHPLHSLFLYSDQRNLGGITSQREKQFESRQWRNVRHGLSNKVNNESVTTKSDYFQIYFDCMGIAYWWNIRIVIQPSDKTMRISSRFEIPENPIIGWIYAKKLPNNGLTGIANTRKIRNRKKISRKSYWKSLWRLGNIQCNVYRFCVRAREECVLCKPWQLIHRYSNETPTGIVLEICVNSHRSRLHEDEWSAVCFVVQFSCLESGRL